MHGPVAVELLRPLVRDPHQQLIVIVRIVGMPLEVGMQALDAGFLIAANSDPVLAGGVVQLNCHAVSQRSNASGSKVKRHGQLVMVALEKIIPIIYFLKPSR